VYGALPAVYNPAKLNVVGAALMVRDGLWYALALGALAALGWYLGGPIWALPQILLAAFVLYFFRDPDRTPPPGALIVSPADGKVLEVEQTAFDGRPAWKIGIFLNIFNVHVNRSPVSGIIRDVRYTCGKFLVASRREACSMNEQNTVAIEADGFTIAFKQIAGLIARRIVFNKKVGDRVACGERVGLIKFGSRVDVFLPTDFRLLVAVGEHVSAGTTVLAVPANRPAGLDSESASGQFAGKR
jgi:phosphatidylserine decarboxylase